jgi:hypothetical protein
VVADPLPVLTTTAITQMTTFWTRFMQEPESIRTTARRAHLREVAVPLGEGEEQVSVVMVDMVALAAQSPSVAADLQTAGFTAQQHDAYRVALTSARLTMEITVDIATQLTAEAVQLTDAVALQKVGLTVQQQEAYRIALQNVKSQSKPNEKSTVMATRYGSFERLADSAVWARYATDTTWYGMPLVANTELVQWMIASGQGSVLGKNIVFLDAHKDELEPLEATGMWSTP